MPDMCGGCAYLGGGHSVLRVSLGLSERCPPIGGRKGLFKGHLLFAGFCRLFQDAPPAGNISVSSIEVPESIERISGIGETLMEGKELVLSGPTLAGASAGPAEVDSGRAELGSTTGRGGWEGADIAIRNEC